MPTTKTQSERQLIIKTNGEPKISLLTKKEQKAFFLTLEAEIRLYFCNENIEKQKDLHPP